MVNDAAVKSRKSGWRRSGRLSVQKNAEQEISNTDESRLIVRAAPEKEKTVIFKKDKSPGDKKSKERLPIIFTMSITG